MTEVNRNMQMVRLQKLIDFLGNSRYGYTVTQILDKLLDHGLDPSKRTVYRDIEALQAMGYSLIEDKVTHKWRLDSDTTAGHAFQITPKALIGLYILKGIASPLMESPLSQDLTEFFNTIDSKVGVKGREYLSELSQSVHFTDGAAWASGISDEIINTIRSACTERQMIEADYESVQNGLRTRKLGPQSLYFAQGSFYLIAEDIEAKQTKTFALPRFKMVTMLDEAYEGVATPPAEMLTNSFAVFMGSAAEKVEMLFDKEMALYIQERRWHASQSITLEPDGRVRLKVELAVTPDFIAWVMGFGDKLEVISPASLRVEISRQISNMTERYKQPKAS